MATTACPIQTLPTCSPTLGPITFISLVAGLAHHFPDDFDDMLEEFDFPSGGC